MGLTLGLLTSGQEHRCCLLRSPAESEPGRSMRRNRTHLTGCFIGDPKSDMGVIQVLAVKINVFLVLVVVFH